MREAKEFKLQLAVIEHHKLAFPYIKAIHIPNESRDATEGYFNKLLGVEPGASDILLGWSSHLYGGMGVGVCELKSEDGKLSTSQNKFLSWADGIGWHTGVARTVKQYHEVICSWGHSSLIKYIREPDLRSHEEKVKAAIDWFRP